MSGPNDDNARFRGSLPAAGQQVPPNTPINMFTQGGDGGNDGNNNGGFFDFGRRN